MKPAIGITLSMRRKENSLTLSRDNADAVLAAGGIPFLLPYATEADVLDGMTKQIDGLLLTGGDDIDPSLFGEEPLPGLGEVEPERDRMEIALARRMVKAGKPVLAICRGCQILCIALGGDMYQDLYSQREDLIQHVQRGPREYLSHSIQIREGTLLSQIAGADRIPDEPQINNILSEPTSIRVHSFEWSALSMGWYESLLWGFIFASEMVVGSASGSTPGTVGVWNGTGIRLFRVQETAVQGPTLLAPKGAVDAVGSSLVQRIGNLNLRGRNNSVQDTQSTSRSPSVREV